MNSNNSTIAKNTILLYSRMFLLLLVTLYTSRVILKSLGIDDYGIFCLINGVVVSFAFIRNVLVSSSQRFLSTSLGKNDIHEFNSIYNTCIKLFFIAGAVSSLLLELIGVWFIYQKLTIPIERFSAAIILFHFSVGDFFFSFIRIPFNSAIISYEKMSFYAYVSIAEALLKLLVVFLLDIIGEDKLIMYGAFLMFITIIINIFYIVYPLKRLIGCEISLKGKMIKTKSILSFSAWSLFEGLANILKTEGIGFILNIMFGVTINAAVGVAKQINSAVGNFVSNFQTAFRPQITKSFASGENDRLVALVFNTSKLSYLIFAIIAVPICVNIEYILSIWLVEVPKFSGPFAICLVASLFFETCGGPLWMTSHAIGNIRNYQLFTSIIRSLNIPTAFFLLKFGMQPAYVFVFQVLLDFLILLYRIFYLKRKISFPAMKYMKEVLLRVLISIMLVLSLCWIICIFSNSRIIELFSTTFISFILFIFLGFYYIFSKEQRQAIFLFAKNKLLSMKS